MTSSSGFQMYLSFCFSVFLADAHAFSQSGWEMALFTLAAKISNYNSAKEEEGKNICPSNSGSKMASLGPASSIFISLLRPWLLPTNRKPHGIRQLPPKPGPCKRSGSTQAKPCSPLE